MFKKLSLVFILSALVFSSLQARQNQQQREELRVNAIYNKTIRSFMAEDRRLKQLVYDSYVYIVFPSIGKGGLILGGAHGEGRAYRKGTWIGNVTLTQYTVGLQVGGQTYKEIIFFRTHTAFKAFKKSGLKSGTQISAIAGTAGVSGDIDINKEVLVFTTENGGLMFEASTGAQDFTYTEKVY